MSFSESEIRDILRYYNARTLKKFKGKLDSGFFNEIFANQDVIV
ncbi:MAG: hypothetical protein ACFFB0_15350 [Promethearchaeota archaeon]